MSELKEIIKRLEEIQKELNKLFQQAEVYVRKYYDSLDFDTLILSEGISDSYYGLIHDVKNSLEKVIRKLKDLESDSEEGET